jgi:hypothetical protein
MPSKILEICEALKTSLAGVTWSIPSVAVNRRNFVTIDPDDMVSPVMFVTPGSVEIQRIGRNSHQYDYSVSVFVGRQAATESAADGMLSLAEDALSAIRAHSWPAPWAGGVTSPVSLGIEINPDDALNERNVWRAVISATYRVNVTDN